MKIVQLQDKNGNNIYPVSQVVKTSPGWFSYTYSDKTKAFNDTTFTITSPLGYQYTFAPYNHSTGFVISGDNVQNVLAIKVYQAFRYNTGTDRCKDIGMRDCSNIDSRYMTLFTNGTISSNNSVGGSWVFPREYDTGSPRAISLVYELDYNKYNLTGFGKCRYAMMGQLDAGYTNLQITRNSRDRIGTLYLSYGANITSYQDYYFHIDILESAPTRHLFDKGSINKLVQGVPSGLYNLPSGATITTDSEKKTLIFVNNSSSTDCHPSPAAGANLYVSFLRKVKSGSKIKFGYKVENTDENGKTQLYLFTGTSEDTTYDGAYEITLYGSDHGEREVTLSGDKYVGWRIDNDTPGSTATFKDIYFTIDE